MTVKIAEGFVEVTAKTDTTKTRRSAEKAGKESGGWFARTFGRSTEKGMGREQRRLNTIFTKSGTSAGGMFSKGMRTSILKGSRKTDAAASASGVSAGNAFVRGYTVAVDKAKAPMGFFARIRRGASSEGDSAGSAFSGGLGKSVSRGMGGMVSSVGSAFGSMGKMPWVLVGIIAVAMAALPALGATAALGMTLAFGAGIAGIGLLAAAQSAHVQQHFSDLKDHVVSTMREIAAPLEDTLVDVSDDLTELFDSLSPHLEQAFEDMAPALSRFSDDLFGAFEGDGTLIQGATDAFTGLLDALGPELEGAFGRMGDALTDLFETVEENPDVFAGIIIGALNFVTGLAKVVGWLAEAYVWISEKVPGGLLTLISPLAGLTSQLFDTEEAGGSLTDKFREMGDALSEAWGHISDGIEDLKTTVMPILEDIQDALADSDVMDTVSGWWTDISEIVALGGEVIGTIMHRIADVIGFIWENFGSNIIRIFSGLWDIVSGIVSGAFEVIKGLFNTFIGVFTGDWSRAWEGIKQIFGGLWEAVVGIFTGAWKIMTSIGGAIVRSIIAAFTWLYDKIVGNSIVPDLVNAVVGWFTGLRDRGAELFGQVRDWIVERVKAMRDWVLTAVLTLRNRAIGFITGLRDRATSLASDLRDWIVSRVTTLRDKIVNRFESIRDRAISAFRRAKDGIADVWKKLQDVTKRPVNFVIETVYTKGIKKFWDSIAGKLGDSVGKLPPITKLATGGRTHGGVPGKDSIPSLLMADEYVIKRDSARKIGFGALEHMNRTGELPMQKFAKGGIVGAVSDFMSKGQGHFSDGFMKAVRAVTGPIKATMRETFGSSGFRGLPTKIVSHLTGKLESFLSPFESKLSGGDGNKVVRVAEKYVGDRGNPNKWTRRMGMNGLPWCGMFVDGVFNEAGAGKALNGVSGTAAVRNYRVLPRVSKENARPGDLPLYRGDDGHINIFTGKGATTIGGNESNSVRKQSGYMNSASSIRRPKFADGGLVDLAAIVGQDRRETTDIQTPLKTKLLREAMSGTPWERGTHDGGGILLDGSAAANQSGRAELVTTLEQLKALVAAGRGATYIFEEGAITIDASKLKDIADLMDMIGRLEQTARQHGARVRVGAPR